MYMEFILYNKVTVLKKEINIQTDYKARKMT